MFRSLQGRVPGVIDARSCEEFSVLAPYLPEEKALLFQVRASSLHRQPGEICFPGGKMEPGETPLSAAIRETTEELLVPRESIEPIAQLDTLEMLNDTRIYAHLAYLHGYAGAFNADEVESVFTVPFSFFLENEPIVHYNRISSTPEDPQAVYSLLGMESYPWRGTRASVLFYQYGEEMIWGMTAKIIHNLVELYRGS